LETKTINGDLKEARYEGGDVQMRIKAGSVFEKTFDHYLARIRQADLGPLEERLGVIVEDNDIVVPFFGKPYRVSDRDILDPSGKRPPLDICVILCKYILICPDESPAGQDWVTYKDFKESGPLTTYFSHDVEHALAAAFSGRVGLMAQAGERLGGYGPEMNLAYDFSMRFDGLPRVPVILLFNDADDEFPAKCTVLFQRRAEQYLDAESLAMLGRNLYFVLQKEAESLDMRYGM
jgi:hypothetical protein